MKSKNILVNNKKAFFNYEIQDSYEAGIELIGNEVKSLRAGHASLEGSYVLVKSGQVYLHNARISPFQGVNAPKDYDENRERKLLLHKKEIVELTKNETGKGHTIVPLSIYTNNGKIKVEIATARGKKVHDKRETIKKRDTDREIRRDFKSR